MTGPIAIIPARGGSKRIPGKNIRAFHGKPIILYSIEAAKASGMFSRIVISTDSPEIAKVAVEAGAEVPFLRPPELANDFAGTAEVLIHALKELGKSAPMPEFFCCIYATAPFLKPEILSDGYSRLVDSGGLSAFSVTTFPYPIQRALRLTAAGRVEMVDPAHKTTRSQDLEERYHDAGQFYWGRTREFLESGSLLEPDAVPVPLPRYLVQDLDTEEDWVRAEAMYQALRLQGMI